MIMQMIMIMWIIKRKVILRTMEQELVRKGKARRIKIMMTRTIIMMMITTTMITTTMITTTTITITTKITITTTIMISATTITEKTTTIIKTVPMILMERVKVKMRRTMDVFDWAIIVMDRVRSCTNLSKAKDV